MNVRFFMSRAAGETYADYLNRIAARMIIIPEGVTNRPIADGTLYGYISRRR